MNVYSDIVLFAISLLVNFLLFGILIAVGIAVTFRLIPNIHPRIYYVISVAAFLTAIFVPLTVTFQGFFNTLPVPAAAIRTEQKSAEEIVIPETNQPADTPQVIEQNVTEQTAKSPETNLLSGFIFFISNSLIGVFCVGFWILISAYLLCQEIIGHRKLRKSRDSWRVATALERKELSCPDDINLYFADNQSPYTAGLLRPAIILPKHFSDNLSPDSIRFIVYHEIAHARWFDPLVNAVLRTLRALFWTSPGLWFLEYVAKREREAAADRVALSAVSNSNNDREAAKEYAELLLSIAKISARNSKPSQTSLTAVYFGGASMLENRIQRLLDRYSSPKPFQSFLAIAAFSTVILGMTYIPVVSKPERSIYPELSFNEFDIKTSDSILDSIKQGFTITDKGKKIISAEKSINSVAENGKTLMLSGSETDSDDAADIKQDINSDGDSKQDVAKTTLYVESIKEMPESATANATAEAAANPMTTEIVTEASIKVVNRSPGDSANIKSEQENESVKQDKSPDFIDEMASVGFTNLSVGQLVKLRQAGVTADYVRGFRAIGLTNLSRGEFVNLGLARVTPALVKKLQIIGYGNLSFDQLTNFGYFNVTPEFINSLRAAGLNNLSPEELVSLRLSNITAEFARSARDRSGSITVKQIIELKKKGAINKSAE
jgi:beta-lactamase regulating signal transducer with metallopeptidase domain